MSSGAFNKFLSQSIVDRARQELLKLGTQVITNSSGKTQVAETSPLAIEQIRKETNLAKSGYQSIVSRQGLQNLAQEFSDYLEDNALGKAASELISRPDIFNAFREFIKQEYSDSSVRRSNSKAYSYETLKTAKGDIRLGTSKSVEEEDIIVFKNLNHGDLKPLFIRFLGTICDDAKLLEFVSKNLDAGHLAGVFNLRFQRIFNLQVSTTGAETYRDFKVTAGTNEDLNKTFNEILKLLSDADYISSNIVYDIKLASSAQKDLYSKSGPSVAAELQLSIANQTFGRALAVVGRRLNELIVAVDAKRGRTDAVAAKQAADNIIKSLRTVAQLVIDTGNKLKTLGLSKEAEAKIAAIMGDTDNILKLIDTPGSDTYLDSIEKSYRAALAGKPMPARQQTKVKRQDSVKVGRSGSSRVPQPKLTKKASTINVNIQKIVPANLDPQLNLVSLQSFINTHLQDVISANMGDGNRRDILNYRSGRFASTVKVERMSKSREGMITAFYSYMKNPYATFSQGGMQSIPASRDPQLLIAKSIREIAAEKVANRMRSVST